MKLTNKIALISGLGCLALVGSGFAAWTYADAKVTDAVNTVSASAATVNSTAATITATVAGVFELDQDTSKSGYVGMLTWTTKWAASATLTGDSHFNIADYTLTYAVTLSSGLEKYVTMTDATGNWTNGNQIAVAFAFNQTNVPDTLAKYNQMKTDIGDKAKVTVTFSAAYSKNA